MWNSSWYVLLKQTPNHAVQAQNITTWLEKPLQWLLRINYHTWNTKYHMINTTWLSIFFDIQCKKPKINFSSCSLLTRVPLGHILVCCVLPTWYQSGCDKKKEILLNPTNKGGTYTPKNNTTKQPTPKVFETTSITRSRHYHLVWEEEGVVKWSINSTYSSKLNLTLRSGIIEDITP